MANETAYPIPVFHFSVEVAGLTMNFSEVTGLTQETQPLEYRHGGTGFELLPLKRPGQKKATNISLKRGMTQNNLEFFDWLNSEGKPNALRKDFTITLLNDESEAVFSWSVKQAWPIKWEVPGLKASGNEIAIESLELVHEGVSLLTPAPKS